MSSHSDKFKPAGRPVKASDQALAKIEEAFPSAEVEFIPSMVKGEGKYVLRTSVSFSRDNMTDLGLDATAARALEADRLMQWRVPPEIMNKIVPGASDMTPEELTQAIRQVPGHETTKVYNMSSHEEGAIVMSVKSSVSRSGFVGADGDKNSIKMYNFGEKEIVVPEQQMNAALGITEQGPRR